MSTCCGDRFQSAIAALSQAEPEKGYSFCSMHRAGNVQGCPACFPPAPKSEPEVTWGESDREFQKLADANNWVEPPDDPPAPKDSKEDAR